MPPSFGNSWDTMGKHGRQRESLGLTANLLLFFDINQSFTFLMPGRGVGATKWINETTVLSLF
jgi:hypothetical protein